MLSIWEHARVITHTLADSLSDFEVRSPGVGFIPASCHPSRLASVRAAIADAWRVAVDHAEKGQGDLTIAYLASLHELLAAPAGAEGPGEFSDDGQPTPWHMFIAEATVEGPPDEACVLAQLYWGGHIRSMALSLGWLCLNQVRLREGRWAISPPPSDHERLLRFLGYAGPECYDAESLRALIGEYAQSQQPS